MRFGADVCDGVPVLDADPSVSLAQRDRLADVKRARKPRSSDFGLMTRLRMTDSARDLHWTPAEKVHRELQALGLPQS